MLKNLRFPTWLNAALLCIAVLLVFASATLSPSYKACVTETAEKNPGKQQQSFENRAGTLFICEAATMNENAGAITALATIAIAVFTLTLWAVTRLEFYTVHRPRIVVHSVEYSTDVSGDPPMARIGAEVSYSNPGDTEAKDIVISGVIINSAERPTVGITPPELVRRKLCSPGVVQFQRVAVFSNMPTISHEVTALLHAREDKREYISNLYCIGTIAYSDKNGIGRVTGFCWRLHGRERWVRQSRSAYEYAY